MRESSEIPGEELVRIASKAETVEHCSANPEEELYIAIIERAWRDLVSPYTAKDLLWVRKDAADWFLCEDNNAVSFLHLAEELKLGNKFIGLALRRAKEILAAIPAEELRQAGIVQKRYHRYWSLETKEAREKGPIRPGRPYYFKNPKYGLAPTKGAEDEL